MIAQNCTQINLHDFQQYHMHCQDIDRSKYIARTINLTATVGTQVKIFSTYKA